MEVTPQRGAGLYNTPNRRSRCVAPKYLGHESSFDNTVDDVDEITTICVVGDRLRNNAEIMADINSFNLKVVFSR